MGFSKHVMFSLPFGPEIEFMAYLQHACIQHKLCRAVEAGIFGNAKFECGNNWDPELTKTKFILEYK